MKQLTLSEVFVFIENGSNDERQALHEKLQSIDDIEKVCDIIETRHEQQALCPHCQSSKYYKHGKANGLKRYKCRECNRTFNALTKTPMSRLRKKGKWLAYLRCMTESKTIRQSARRLEVNNSTAFRWRHRFLSWITLDHPEKLKGVVEIDETYFLESEKGSRKLKRPARKRGGKAKKRGLSSEQVCVLVACDRNGGELDFITGRGAVTHNWLEENLPERIEPDCLLISDGHKPYKSFSQQHDLSHVIVRNKLGMRTQGAWHIQNVNAYHSRLKQWMRRFNGVATKYLDHYLGWQHELDDKCISGEIPMLKAAIGVFPQLTRT